MLDISFCSTAGPQVTVLGCTMDSRRRIYVLIKRNVHLYMGVNICTRHLSTSYEECGKCKSNHCGSQPCKTSLSPLRCAAPATISFSLPPQPRGAGRASGEEWQCLCDTLGHTRRQRGTSFPTAELTAFALERSFYGTDITVCAPE